MILKYEDFFNEDSICIFTDSSFKNQSLNKQFAIGTTAPAACIYCGNNCIDKVFYILHNSTSQQGELYALLLGVMESYKYRNFKHIRLFSDSLNSIAAVRDRIFNWARKTPKGEDLINSSGIVKNQDMIMDIIYYILSNNIPIELYHVKGHVDITNKESFNHARDVFLNSNGFINNNEPTLVADILIEQLATMNNCVDNFSTKMLKENILNSNYNTSYLTPAVTIGYTPFDMYNYYSLINKDGIVHNIF